MENKKGKKLSLQKIKIAKLNQNGLRHVQGGTGENPIDFSATQCVTDTCPGGTINCTTKEDIMTTPIATCNSIIHTNCKSDFNCRSDGRDCVNQQ